MEYLNQYNFLKDLTHNFGAESQRGSDVLITSYLCWLPYIAKEIKQNNIRRSLIKKNKSVVVDYSSRVNLIEEINRSVILSGVVVRVGMFDGSSRVLLKDVEFVGSNKLPTKTLRANLGKKLKNTSLDTKISKLVLPNHNRRVVSDHLWINLDTTLSFSDKVQIIMGTRLYFIGDVISYVGYVNGVRGRKVGVSNELLLGATLPKHVTLGVEPTMFRSLDAFYDFTTRKDFGEVEIPKGFKHVSKISMFSSGASSLNKSPNFFDYMYTSATWFLGLCKTDEQFIGVIRSIVSVYFELLSPRLESVKQTFRVKYKHYDKNKLHHLWLGWTYFSRVSYSFSMKGLNDNLRKHLHFYIINRLIQLFGEDFVNVSSPK